MKKFFQTVTALLVAFALVAAPVVDAQTRGRGGAASGATAPNRTHGNHSGAHRPSDSNRPSGMSRPSRPAGNDRPSTPANNHRPSNPGRPNTPAPSHRPTNNNNRPGAVNRPDLGNRPDQGRPGNGNHRPGNGNHRPDNGNHRPDNGRPGNGGHHRPDNGRPGNGGHYRPGGNGYHRPPAPPRPPRHHGHGYRHPVPFFGTYHRPVPPPRWHYVSGGPVFGTILGIALGTAITASINSLVNSGYTVSSYGNDVVYLNDVPQLNYYWPDAALYYNNGRLYGSQFTYSSPYYDMNRYNTLYNTLMMQYGAPVQVVNNGPVCSATWYGAGNRYVTLSFNCGYSGQFYTTLSFGN